eukprot:scaffold211916_cov31-Tisochrysis_lutea.AAC.3
MSLRGPIFCVACLLAQKGSSYWPPPAQTSEVSEPQRVRAVSIRRRALMCANLPPYSPHPRRRPNRGRYLPPLELRGQVGPPLESETSVCSMPSRMRSVVRAQQPSTPGRMLPRPR